MKYLKSVLLGSALCALATVAPVSQAQSPSAARVTGISSWLAPEAYLHMPPTIAGPLPKLLSQTGAFSDTARMVPTKGLIPYDLIVPFWSDGAVKSRYMAIPKGTQIGYTADGDWTFPAGTVMVKTFELPTDEAHPDITRRLETRLLVRDDKGGVYGVVYKWRADNSDADLLPASSLTEKIPVRERDGSVREQTWYYPSRENCLTCHNAHTTGILGPKARQLNRTLLYPSGVTANEISTLDHLHLLTPAPTAADLAALPTLAAMDDTSRSIEDRARSYLDANCGHCHRPGGTVAYFDARYDTPPAKQEIVDGPVLINEGIDRPHVISPHDIWRSIAFMRVDTNGDVRMPPIARETIDEHGVQLLRDWINSMPGKDVLVPPKISPDGGTFGQAVTVTLSSADAGAQIRYTLDGSAPGTQDMLYTAPIRLTGPTVVRARAYKDGMTRSITAESVFIVGQQ
ncbi:MAG TPA: chitobiase/beta-hexosaminidase C-terminal domain-containing protein [Steroidobacteraceae bacterium]|nr:chitobiase/beta-hexosaminidase C-terminal domain-containing protein [Steroidobacteraceae bacterium]